MHPLDHSLVDLVIQAIKNRFEIGVMGHEIFDWYVFVLNEIFLRVLDADFEVYELDVLFPDILFACFECFEDIEDFD